MRDYEFERDLPDGRKLAVMPLTFDRARLIVGRAEEWRTGYDEGW